jgi:hypothetical protein
MTVDLQLLHRQTHDVRQRGITSAVVVDGQAHAELGEPVEHLLRIDRIFHEAALGDLQAQQRRRHRSVRQAASSPLSADRDS